MKRQRTPWLARLLVLVLACSVALTFALTNAPGASEDESNDPAARAG